MSSTQSAAAVSAVAAPGPNKNIPGLTPPIGTNDALLKCLTLVVQGMQSLAGQRGSTFDRAVTWNDLLALKLLTPQTAATSSNITINSTGAGLPSGAANGDYLGYVGGKATWVDPPPSLPSGGANGDILAFSGGAPAWEEAPPALPTLTTNGYILAIESGEPAWVEPPEALPTIGTAGEVLTVVSGAPAWAAPQAPGLFVDAFGAAGDGVTDDTTKFGTALAALGAAGGGTLWINGAKRYLCAASQLVLPPQVWLRSTGSAAPGSDFATVGGAILLAPGVAMSGSTGSNFWNPERTTLALSMGDGCRVSDITFISTEYSDPVDIVTTQALVGNFANNGNAVQMDGQFNRVERCTFIGFNRGIVSVPEKVDGSGNYVGSAGAAPVITDNWIDCNNPIVMGANGLGGYTANIKRVNLVKPSGISGTPDLGFTVGSDGAGGTLLSALTWKGTLITWPSAMIGTPTTGGQVTISLFDADGNALVSTGDTRSQVSNRYVGVWAPSGSGWNIQIAGMPPTFEIFGATSSGTVGPTGTSATLANAAFTYVTFRDGAILLNQLNAHRFINIATLATGFVLNGCGSIYFNQFSGDAPCWDCGGANGGYLINLEAGCSGIGIAHGYFNNCFGGVNNFADGRPQGSIALTDVTFGGPAVFINHQKNSIIMEGCSLGKSGVLVIGADHGGLSISSTKWATEATDGGVVTVIEASGAAAPYVDANCIGAPADMVAASIVSLFADAFGAGTDGNVLTVVSGEPAWA